MNAIERIEYYSQCPSCGGPRSGNEETCEYCGSSLIKSKSSCEYSAENLKEKFLEEDCGLPEVKGKLCDKNSLMLFWYLFGGIFFSVPTIMFFIFLTVGLMHPFLIGFFCIFWVIGIVSLSIPIRTTVNRRKCMNGTPFEGIVRGYENGNFMINDASVQNIRIRTVMNGQSVIIILETGQTNRKYAIGSTLILKKHKSYYLIG